jgi:hypothetical protein
MSTPNLLMVLKAILQYLTAFLWSFAKCFVVQVSGFVVNMCWPEVFYVSGDPVGHP